MRHARLQGAVRLAVVCVLAAGALGGCGDDDSQESLPEGAVAMVRDHVITRAAVKRAVVGQLALRHSAASMPPYLPTDVEGCIADHRERTAERDATPDELRERCQRERERHEAAALALLIRWQWYRLQAKRDGIEIPTERQAAARASAHAGVNPAYLRGVTEALLLQYNAATRRAKHQSNASGDQILARYNARLRSEYADDTVCADDLDVPGCD